MLLSAIGLFFSGSLLCGCACNMPSLIGFLALQRIGAGGLMPIAQTIIGDLFTPAERTRIQGWLSSIGAFGAIIGPLIGAFLISHTIWPMVFRVNLPIGGTAGAALILTLREQLECRCQRIDYLGSALMILSTCTLMFALVDAAKLQLALFFALVSAAVLLLGLSVLHERRTPEPMLPLGLWRNPIIPAATSPSWR